MPADGGAPRMKPTKKRKAEETVEEPEVVEEAVAEERREKKAKKKGKEREAEKEQSEEKKAKKEARQGDRAKEPAALAEALASPVPGDAAAAAVPAEVKRECRELFLGHCPPSVTVKHVYDHWSGLGNDVITNIKWVKRVDGKFSGVGFVEFATPRLCKLAMKLNKRHPFEVDGKPITVTPSFKGAKEKAVKHRLFLGRCPLGAHEAAIRAHYESLGADAIQHVKWVKGEDADTQAAFLTFRTKEELEQALALGRPLVQGVLLKVRKAGRRLAGGGDAQPEAWVQETVHVTDGADKVEQNPEHTLFWKGLPDDVDDAKVFHFYKKLPEGSIVSTRWMGFPPRGTVPQSKCFITFRDRPTAEKALGRGAPTFAGRLARVGLVKP